MEYYQRIATYTKKELLKEAEKNMKHLDELKVSYKRGKNYQFLKEKLNKDPLKIKELSGDELYLLNVNLNIIINKNTVGKEKI